MALHDDLLKLAREVLEITQGPGRPRQAVLRRAVSTAYTREKHPSPLWEIPGEDAKSE